MMTTTERPPRRPNPLRNEEGGLNQAPISDATLRRRREPRPPTDRTVDRPNPVPPVPQAFVAADPAGLPVRLSVRPSVRRRDHEMRAQFVLRVSRGPRRTTLSE